MFLGAFQMIFIFGRAESEEPLRATLNPNDGWVYPVMLGSQPAHAPSVLSETEDEIGNPRTTLQIPLPGRLSPTCIFGRAESEEPLRAILNPNDGWVYPVMMASQSAHAPSVLSETEAEIENSRTTLQIPLPGRLSHFA